MPSEQNPQPTDTNGADPSPAEDLAQFLGGATAIPIPINLSKELAETLIGPVTGLIARLVDTNEDVRRLFLVSSAKLVFPLINKEDSLFDIVRSALLKEDKPLSDPEEERARQEILTLNRALLAAVDAVRPIAAPVVAAWEAEEAAEDEAEAAQAAAAAGAVGVAVQQSVLEQSGVKVGLN